MNGTRKFQQLVSQLDLAKVGPACALVREVRELYGKKAARDLWDSLPLPPAEAFAARRPQKQRRDAVALFIADCTIRADRRCQVQALALYQAYVAWSELADIDVLTLTAFGRELGALGFDKIKRGRWYYVALQLRAASPAPPRP